MENKATKIVKEILRELNGRKGLGIEDLDEDIQEEIVETLEQIVIDNLTT